MQTVRMQHPDLPGQIYEAPETAVPHHVSAGWVVADEPEQAAAPAAGPERSEQGGEQDQAQDAQKQSPRRRRTTTDEGNDD